MEKSMPPGLVIEAMQLLKLSAAHSGASQGGPIMLQGEADGNDENRAQSRAATS
jgi:hypothetical protein